MNNSSQTIGDAAEDADPKRPDLSAFHRHDRSGEFIVEVHVSGAVTITVEAEDAEAAKREVEAMLDAGEVDLFAEDIDDADISYVRPCPTMYLVKRDGKEMGVSHVQPGDEPCEPTSKYMARDYLPPAGRSPND